MTTPPRSSFIHLFIPGSPEVSPLLLLHGTGGNEEDLIPLGKTIAPGRTLLSPRGQVLENGMPRFFRRLAEGIFDEPDLRRRAGDLANFINEARKIHDLKSPIAVGFSNGANIAAALLFLHPQALAGAVLLRAMVPFKNSPAADLAAKPVLILSGTDDPIIPSTNATSLAAELRSNGATVEHRTLPAGHNLTQLDVSIATEWLKRID